MSALQTDFDLSDLSDAKSLFEAIVKIIEHFHRGFQVLHLTEVQINTTFAKHIFPVEVTQQSDNKFAFATFTDLTFEMSARSTPEALLIYSHDDSPISTKYTTPVQVTRLQLISQKNHKYQFETESVNAYQSEHNLVLKPYLLVVTSGKKIGFGIILTLDKSKLKLRREDETSSESSYTATIDFTNITFETLASKYYDFNDLYKLYQGISYHEKRYLLQGDEVSKIKEIAKQQKDILNTKQSNL